MKCAYVLAGLVLGIVHTHIVVTQKNPHYFEVPEGIQIGNAITIDYLFDINKGT